jgi:PHYB activation tagged suppressor 1
MFVVVMALMVAVALSSSWALSVLSRLVWRPQAITRMFRAQGVRGPEYRFLLGNIGDMKRFLAESAGLVLDVGCHDYSAMVQPWSRKWMTLYGTYIHVYVSILACLSLGHCLNKWYFFTKLLGRMV